MARKSVDLPTGVEIRNGAIRIRFTKNGQRCSETLPYPATQAGIASASRLRDQVVSLNKLGLLDEAKYSELFPNSVKASESIENTFGAYAQMWLNSRSIVEGTRDNYKSALNIWLMPTMATKHLLSITPTYLRKFIAETNWTSEQVKLHVMIKLSTILESAVNDKILTANPMEGLDLPKRVRKKVDPFTQAEADKIIDTLYKTLPRALSIYAAYYEFAFYTGMRPAEIMALRWEEVNFTKKTAHICRIVAKRVIVERTKTKKPRYVLLNSRAIHALEFAKEYVNERAKLKRGADVYPYCFPPSQRGEFISVTGLLHNGWRELLTSLGIKYKRPYNTRHTYATMCLMAGMAPAFIAKQLGHSVEMLLSTYAQWLSNDSDWDQMSKLNIAPEMPQRD